MGNKGNSGTYHGSACSLPRGRGFPFPQWHGAARQAALCLPGSSRVYRSTWNQWGSAAQETNGKLRSSHGMVNAREAFKRRKTRAQHYPSVHLIMKGLTGRLPSWSSRWHSWQQAACKQQGSWDRPVALQTLQILPRCLLNARNSLPHEKRSCLHWFYRCWASFQKLGMLF